MTDSDKETQQEQCIVFAHGISESTQKKARPIISARFPEAAFVMFKQGYAAFEVFGRNGLLWVISIADAIGLDKNA